MPELVAESAGFDPVTRAGKRWQAAAERDKGFLEQALLALVRGFFGRERVAHGRWAGGFKSAPRSEAMA